MAKKIPINVKIISVLGYTAAFLCVSFGFSNLLILGIPEAPILGLFFIFFGVFMIFVSYGLWKGKKWARIGAIVINFLFVLGSLVLLPAIIVTSVILIIINLLICSYLLFSKIVRKTF